MENIYYPIESLEWCFWNQSITKKHYNNSEFEFNTHIGRYKDSIDKIASDNDISTDVIIAHLYRYWNAAIEKKYINMHYNDRRFKKYVVKNKLIKNDENN